MESGYRYKDMAILIRNGHDYEELLETVFSDHEIPYFIDRKLPMLNHPLIELIRSALEVIATNWSYEPVFRAIKTDLLFPIDANREELREDMDKLENYVLANGIRWNRWTEKNKWTYKRYQGLEFENTPQTDAEIKMENKINQSRSMVAMPFTRLARRLKQAVNGRAMCESVYLMLEELEIPAKA